MRNWDADDERGRCATSDEELEDAKYVCRVLKLPIMELNFAKEYWNNVFTYVSNDLNLLLTLLIQYYIPL